ncbi:MULTISPECIES: MarR family transcriptional regulator [Clostridium]|uniref:MarR family transcriptional regulator n=1 Tax=Clostridium cibarium TaxID=2762247 RepID=A0ABR8PW22_9CLOT|nr:MULTISPECIES: MarR family transcriptional regulator [Clostridium]MBD7912380.1 MarR family transcriptional regulator [Clostridium cibarium]
MNSKFRDLIRLTNNIYRYTQVYLDKKLEKLNITTGSYPYLLVLNKNEGISQNEISRELNVDKAMSARIIKKLIELEYVRKEENEKDIRAYKLFLTKRGREVIPEIHNIIEEWTNMIIQGNEEEQIESSIEFLDKVLENAKEIKKNCCERMKNIE